MSPVPGQRVTPMIHVPDVRATAAWYEAIGFEIRGTNEDCGEMNWALLTYLGSRVMFSLGGSPSTAHRREMDLFIQVTDLDAVLSRVRSRAEMVEDVHDTEYGMREFIVRDLNGFWITFGQPLT